MTTDTQTFLLKGKGDVSQAVNELRRLGKEWEAVTKRFGAATRPAAAGMDVLRDKMDQARKAGQLLAVTFGALAAAGGALLRSVSRVAMRNEVLAISLYTVAKNAGYSREEMDALTDRVKALGITTSQARLGLTRMLQGQLNLAKATDLARTAQDLAVIAGENSSATFGNLMEAVTSLQPRMLRQYGIVTTLDQALGDLANSTDATAKRNRMLQFVLDEGAKVAGVYEEAMGAVGKRITSIPRLIEEAKASFGKHLLPIIGLGVDLLSKLLEAFEALPPGVQKGLAMAVLFGTTISAVLAAIAGLAVALPFVISGLSALAGLLGVTATTIGGMVAGIGAVVLPILAALAAAVGSLIAIGAALVAAWRNNWGGIRDAVAEAWMRIKPLLQELVGLISGWGAEFKRQAMQIWAAVRSILEPLFARLAGFIRSIDWSDLFTTLKDALNVAGNYISAWLETIQRLLRGEGFRAFSSLEGAAVDALTLVALVFDKYIRPAAVWGWNLIVNFANGLMRAAQSVLVAVMNAIGNLIGRFLAPGSPPKKGPLANIIKWGQGIINTFLRAFGLADFGLMRTALSPIRDALESALQAGDIDESQFVGLFSKAREEVARLIATFRETGEISEESLGRIAEILGEGSEEYVKFLRLQLEHQKALDNLTKVQEEVAAAEAKGFVPADLKAKLKAAEDAADASKEQVDWQREYLEMQQESVDLQLRLVEALESLAGGGAGGAGGGAGAGAGLAGALGGIGDGLDLGDLDTDLDSVQAKLGGMSDEFVEMRQRVLNWIEAFKQWLALPLDEKIEAVKQVIGQKWEEIRADLEEKWGEIVTSLQERWGEIKTTAQEEMENIRAAIATKLDEVVGKWTEKWDEVKASVQLKLDEIKAGINERLDALFADMGLDLDEMKARWTAIWEDVKLIAGTVWERIVTAVTEKVTELRETVERKIQELKDWWEPKWNAIKTILGTVWGAIVTIATEKIQEVYDTVTEKLSEIGDWINLQVARFKALGSAIIEGIKSGVLAKVGELISAVTGAIEDALAAAKRLLGIESPSRKAAIELGGPFMAGFAEGVLGQMPSVARQLTAGLEDMLGDLRMNPNLGGLQAALGQARLALDGAGVGGVNVTQYFTEPLFPGVTHERDALGVDELLRRKALQGVMASRA